MSNQDQKLIEISETIRDHLIKQNAQSSNDGDCLYKAPNGHMCAVGCLIKPEHYNESFENRGIDDVNVLEAVEASIDIKFSREDTGDDPAYHLLSNWQYYHDSEYLDYLDATQYFGKPARTPAEYHENLINSNAFA